MERAAEPEELLKWVHSLNRSLVYNDPSINAFAAELLAEASQFIEKQRSKGKRSAEARSAVRGGNPSTVQPRLTHGSTTHSFIHSVNNAKPTNSRPAAPSVSLDSKISEGWGKDPLRGRVVELFHLKDVGKVGKRISAIVRDFRALGATPETLGAAYGIAKREWNGGPPFSPEALVKWYGEFSHRAEVREAREKACIHGNLGVCLDCVAGYPKDDGVEECPHEKLGYCAECIAERLPEFRKKSEILNPGKNQV